MDSVFQFLREQFGLTNITANLLWAVLFEAFGITALVRWMLHIFKKQPAQERAFWVAMPLVAFISLLLLHGIVSPSADFSKSIIRDVRIGTDDPPTADSPPTENPRGSTVGFLLNVSLINTGSASSITDPKVKLITPNGESFDGILVPRFAARLKSGAPMAFFANGINPSPIVIRGVIQPIIVVAEFSKVSPHEAERAGTKVELSFIDAFGQSYTIGKVLPATMVTE